MWRQRGRVVRATNLRVQIPFCPLADVVLGSSEFNFSATSVNSQLVCLPPVEILNLVMFIWILIYHCLFTLVLKSPSGEWPITYNCFFPHIHEDIQNVKQFVRSYLLPQFSSWSYYFIKDVFSYMRVHSTEWVIQQVHISVEIHRSCQTDTLFLTSAQVYTLDITHWPVRHNDVKQLHT